MGKNTGGGEGGLGGRKGKEMDGRIEDKMKCKKKK